MIFRFKFEETFAEELGVFAKTNKYADREDFKERWELWLEENADIVNTEKTRLETIGYTGNVYEKMYKSARYYFRKKGAPNEPRERRAYFTADKELLERIDQFLENIRDKSPKEGFASFCEDNRDIEIEAPRLKKIFKNRYFIMAKKTL